MRLKTRSFAFRYACLLAILASQRASAQTVDFLTVPSASGLMRTALPAIKELLRAPDLQEPQFIAGPLPQDASPDPLWDLQLRFQFPNLTKPLVRHSVKELAHSIAVVNCETAEDGAVLRLCNGSLAALGQRHESLRGVNSAQFLQLCLVHHFTGRHVDRRFCFLEQMAKCKDCEEFQILLALREGERLFLTRAIARRLGCEAAISLLTEVFRHVPDCPTDNAARMVRQELAQTRCRLTLKGLAFLDFLDRRNLHDCDAIVRRLPRQLEWLDRPERYVRALETSREDVTAAMKRLESALPANEWQMSQQPWTADMVRQVAALLGLKDKADHVLRPREEGRSAVLQAVGNSACQVAVSMARFESAVAARAYLGFAIDLQRKLDESSGLPCTGATRVLESRSSVPSFRQQDEAVRIDKRLQLPGNTTQLFTSVFLLRKGDCILEINWHGRTADPAATERIVEAALGK